MRGLDVPNIRHNNPQNTAVGQEKQARREEQPRHERAMPEELELEALLQPQRLRCSPKKGGGETEPRAREERGGG